MVNSFKNHLITQLATKHHITAGIIDGLCERSSYAFNEYYVPKGTYEKLCRIQDKIDAFEATENNLRGFYLELENIGTIISRKELKYIWYEFYSEHFEDASLGRLLMIKTKSGDYVRIYNSPKDMEYEKLKETNKVIDQLLSFLEDFINAVLVDVDGYNTFVENNLPYQYRKGKILRKELNRILPWRKIKVSDKEKAIKALEASINEPAPPIKTMTIRKYCEIYRIALSGYNRFFFEGKDKFSELDDMEVYRRNNGRDPLYEPLDSEEMFIKFAYDHYADLSYIRDGLLAKQTSDGWIMDLFYNRTYSIGLMVDVATALYLSNIPFTIKNTEKILALLKDEEYDAIVNNYHQDYFNKNGQTSFVLPFEMECTDVEDEPITKANLKEIIALTEWEAIPKIAFLKTPEVKESITFEDYMHERRENEYWINNARIIVLKIIDIMQEQNLYHTQFGEKIGCSEEEVIKILDGNPNLSLKTISKIEKVFNVEIIKK